MKSKYIAFVMLLFTACLFSRPLEVAFFSTYSPGEEDYKVIEQMKQDLLVFSPITVFADHVNFSYNQVQKLPVSITDYKGFSIHIKNSIAHINQKSPSLSIFVVPSAEDLAQGGTIGTKKYPVVYITAGAAEGTLRHEVVHALTGLGDEYGGILPFAPSQKEIAKYKNLSLTGNNEKWREIKIAAGDNPDLFYEGGLEREEGVFRPYPDCLMRSLSAPLCKVCLYYTLEALSELTGVQVDIEKKLRIFEKLARAFGYVSKTGVLIF